MFGINFHTLCYIQKERYFGQTFYKMYKGKHRTCHVSVSSGLVVAEVLTGSGIGVIVKILRLDLLTTDSTTRAQQCGQKGSFTRGGVSCLCCSVIHVL